ncbi:DUF2500 family protein [Lysinibacillus sp. JNUCC 51]|uniref:DUF2500 family protein n=1 Tax=Lysinibacillus sp. JNUCC-51 TaxID=2792479 RepID=UPI001935F2A1|nr:DUF2500 family protein [Lysinibacillus sp. JNUCC-51]
MQRLHTVMYQELLAFYIITQFDIKNWTDIVEMKPWSAEVQSSDRLELKMNGRVYGQLADGDYGLLTFQGTRYHTFERHKKESSVKQRTLLLTFLYYLIKYLPKPPSVSPKYSILLPAGMTFCASLAEL